MKLTGYNLRRLIYTIALIAGIVLALIAFINGNHLRIDAQNEEYIHELTSQRAESIDRLLRENTSFIESTAFLYGEGLESKDADVELIRRFEQNSIFDMLRFIDATGGNYTSGGLAANLSDREYFKSGMRGESGVTYVLESRVTGETQIGFYAPVKYNDEIIGVMVGFYGENYINRLLEYTLFDYTGEGWLCLSDGTVLGSTVGSRQNFFEFMAESGRLSLEQISEIKLGLNESEHQAISFSEQGSAACGDIVKLNGTDWLLVRSFPAEAAENITSNANRHGLWLLLELVILFTVYVTLLAIDVYINHRRTLEAGRDAKYISTGVSELYQSFTLIDVSAGTYRRLSGTYNDSAMPDEGEWRALVEYVLNNVDESEDLDAIRAFFDSERLLNALNETSSTGGRVHYKSGACVMYSFTLAESGSKKLLCIAQDISELDRKETTDRERLRVALSESERANKAKTEFLFNMSHDLRTPMNAIIGCTELARRQNISEQELKGYIGKIDASGRHLLALINDILEMSRIESGKMTIEPKADDLADAIRENGELFSTQMAEKGISFTVDTAGVTHPNVEFDRQHLDRVIMNLVSNAWKFTPEGGQVALTLKETGQSGDTINFRISVKDTGIGISEEFIQKLFKPFERERTSTVSKTQGTGLGLSIAKRIIDLMDGTIKCVSAPNEGTEFIIELSFPEAHTEQASGNADNQAQSEFAFEGLSVLLAEDIEINREIAAMALMQKGCLVETAEDGYQAVELLKSAAPDKFNLVLMDIQMPRMDGYEAAREIRQMDDEIKRNIPIIAMTANAFKEDIMAAAAAGMNAHIAKPLDFDKMYETIARVMTGEEDLQREEGNP